MHDSFAPARTLRQSKPRLRYARGVMTPRLLAVACLALGCGPAATPTTHTTPNPEPAEPEPTDWLVDATRPAPPVDGPGGVEPATPALVFQSVARNNVVDVGFTADGRAVVTLGGDGEASLVDLESGRIRAGRRVFVRRAIRGLDVTDRGIAYVANGTSFGAMGGLRSWDLRTGRLREVELPGLAYVDVQALSVEPRSERLAMIHELEGSTMLRLQGPGLEPRDIPLTIAGFPTVLPTGAVLIHHGDASVELRGFEDEEDEPRFEVAPEGEDQLVLATVHPNGEALFVAAPDAPLLWLDASTGERIAEVSIEHEQPIRALIVSGDGERLALIRQDGGLTLRSTRDGSVIGQTQLPEGWLQAFNGTEGLHLDHAGERLVFLGRQTLTAIPLRVGDENPGEPVAIGLEDYTSGLVLSRDGRWLAVLGRSLTLFDLQAEELVPRRFEPAGGEHSVWGVQWKPDESALVSYGRGGVEWWGRDGFRSTPCRGSGTVTWGDSPSLYMGARRCDLQSGESEEVPTPLAASESTGRVLVDNGRQIEVLGPDGESLGRVRKGRGAPTCRYGQCLQRHTLSADGEVLAFATEREVVVHQRRGRRVGRLRIPDDHHPIQAIELSPDGTALLVFRHVDSEGLRASLHRVRGMASLAEIGVASPNHFAFARETHLLAIANGSEAVLIDATDGRLVATHDAGDGIRKIGITADGAAVIVELPSGLRVLDRDGAPRTAKDGIPLPWAVSADAEKLASCHAGVLVVTDLLTNDTKTMGDCTRGDELSFSPLGTYVTARRGSYVEVHRVADGSGVALHAPRMDENLDRQTHAYAVSDEGAYELAEDADPSRFLYRGPGTMVSAPLVPLSEAAATPGLVARFFGAPAPAD